MDLKELNRNRISSEWKDTFNYNVRQLLGWDQRNVLDLKTIHSRIDNLVLNSGGTSPNEVVDARVNNKGTKYATLSTRLLAAENNHDTDLKQVREDIENQKGQLAQLNDTIAELYGANGTTISIYVSDKSGSDKTGTGTQDNPFKTIQAAVNQVPLISRVNVTVFVDSGVYLEDVVVSNVAASRMYFRPIQDDSVLDGLTADMPVKVRSIAYMYCSGYFQVRGFEFVDQANAPSYGSRKYSIVAEQGSYVAINHCSFKENVKALTHHSVYAGGMSNVNIYGMCTFKNQSIIAYAYLMAQITFNAVQGSGNDVLAQAYQGLIRTGSISIATTAAKTESTGLIIAKGTVL